LLPTLDLSESGFLLQLLVARGKGDSAHTTNPLFVRTRPALVLLYLRLIFGAEILFPYLISEFAERVLEKRPISTRGEAGLLRGAARRLTIAAGEPSDPEDVLATRELHEFEEAILGSRSTEENYLRPRLEMLVDVGLVERRQADTSERPGAFSWTLPAGTLALASRLTGLTQSPLMLDEFLDKSFNGVMCEALGLRLTPPASDAEAVLWFYRAYEVVQREIGFTPGRTVALLASLLAAEHGTLLEVRGLFDLLYSLPNSRLGEYVSFSGGSRFDNEFMIKIDGAILPLLGDGAIANRGKES
jgi:hypothetical protein